MASMDMPQRSEVLRAAYEANDLRELRMAYNDLFETTRAANATERRSRNERLQVECTWATFRSQERAVARIQRPTVPVEAIWRRT